MTITGKEPEDITIAVAGSTGYIGKFVAMECVRRGYKTIALTRDPKADIEGAEMVITDVTDQSSIEAALAGRNVRRHQCYRCCRYCPGCWGCQGYRWRHESSRGDCHDSPVFAARVPEMLCVTWYET